MRIIFKRNVMLPAPMNIVGACRSTYKMKVFKPKYEKLLANIGLTIETARQNAVRIINTELVRANWEIGRHIVEFEQHGEERAEYGSDLLARLSKDLKQQYGKGFGRRNILDMRRFYITWQKWQAVPAKLSWTHTHCIAWYC